MVVETDAEGRTTRYRYDGQDHRVSIKTHLGEETSLLYDDGTHNLKEVKDPLNVKQNATVQQVEKRFYDALGRLDYIMDRRSNTTDYTFNPYHQLERVRTPEGVVTETLYYPEGHAHAGLPQTRKTIAGTQTFTTTLFYDTYGNVQTLRHPDNVEERCLSNLLGDVLSHTDRRGVTTGFTYNKRRQLLRTDLPTVNTVNFYLENVYDAQGNLGSEYDRFRNLTTIPTARLPNRW